MEIEPKKAKQGLMGAGRPELLEGWLLRGGPLDFLRKSMAGSSKDPKAVSSSL